MYILLIKSIKLVGRNQFRLVFFSPGLEGQEGIENNFPVHKSNSCNQGEMILHMMLPFAVFKAQR